MSFEWGSDESSDDQSFGDRPVELGEDGKWQDVATVAPPAQPRAAAPARPQVPSPAPVQQASTHGSTQEEVTEEESEDDFTSVLSDAKLRLAQGSLYEMLMNNNLFQDLDIDPKAVKNVEREVKAFARERMEIMLGMRQEKIAQQYAEFNAQLANPFNDLEVQVLKAIASTATKGASTLPEAQTFNALPAAPRKSSLTPIGNGVPTRKPAAPKATQKLPQGPAAPITRKRLDNAAVEQKLIEDGVEREFIEEAKRQLQTDTYKPIDKPLHELSEQEMLQRNKAATERLGKQPVKSSAALPMPDQDTINAHAMNRAQAAASNPQMQSLMSLLTKK